MDVLAEAAHAPYLRAAVVDVSLVGGHRLEGQKAVRNGDLWEIMTSNMNETP